MIALVLAACLATAPDWNSMEQGSRMAAAQTDVDLCQREAEVMNVEPGSLCNQREWPLRELRQEIAAKVALTRAEFEESHREAIQHLLPDEEQWLARAEADSQELAALKAEGLKIPNDRVHVSHPHRSKGKVAEFKRQWSELHGGLPCPEECATYVKRGGAFVLYYRCTACQVDHTCALACGGPDETNNMRWLDAKENNAKSDDCSLCR